MAPSDSPTLSTTGAGHGDASASARRALEQLYGSHFGKLAGWFRRSGLSESAAHDLAQDSFVNALRAIDQFKGDSQLATWLWAIARNVLLAHWRGKQTPGATPATDADGAPIDPDSLSLGADVHQTDQDDCVRRGFAAFSMQHPARAQVVYLAVVEGWTREELALHIGRTAHAATEYLSQCKARLKPFIEHCHGR